LLNVYNILLLPATCQLGKYFMEVEVITTKQLLTAQTYHLPTLIFDQYFIKIFA